MSSNGEDIIRETFQKLGDAIGVQMQMPDAMITNLGAVLQAQIDLLAELQSTGRLLADDDMRLTAEEVEDVRTVAWYTGAGLSRAPMAEIHRLRALFPATEPAEEVTQAEGFCKHDRSKNGGCSFCGWSSDACARGEGDCAPAEPAEEETKVELCVVRLCVLPARHFGVHADREGLRWNNPASSPVVPAPTETGLWQRIEDVPETVGRLTDRDGDVWEWDGDNWVTPETAILPTVYINKHFAPFVVAEEG